MRHALAATFFWLLVFPSASRAYDSISECADYSTEDCFVDGTQVCDVVSGEIVCDFRSNAIGETLYAVWDRTNGPFIWGNTNETFCCDADDIGDTHYTLVIYGGIGDDEICLNTTSESRGNSTHCDVYPNDDWDWQGPMEYYAGNRDEKYVITSRGDYDDFVDLEDVYIGTLFCDVFTYGGDDIIWGSAVGDKIYAGNGDDEIWGFAGEDKLYGEGGADVIRGGTEDDAIYGASGADTLYGGYGDDEIHGGDDSDKIDGEIGDDIVLGDDGDDELCGGDGTDTVKGQGGGDCVCGGDTTTNDDGANKDSLFGNTGTDTCIYYGGDVVDASPSCDTSTSSSTCSCDCPSS